MAAVARNRSRLADPLPPAKPGSDAYTGILALSLIGMIAGCVFLYLDYSQYGSAKPPTPNIKVGPAPAGEQPKPAG
jgi:hypothetical protein